MFTLQVHKVKTLITEISTTIKLDTLKSEETKNLSKSQHKILSIGEKLLEIERMLNPIYDFSGHTHTRTVKLTTLETLSYQGLLSYHHVIVDKLFQLETY